MTDGNGTIVSSARGPERASLRARAGSGQTVYAGERVLLNGTASEGAPIAFHWDFGDGGSGDGPIGRYVYSRPGSYTARLTVTGRDGKESAGETSIRVLAAEEATGALPFRGMMMMPSDPLAMPWNRVYTDSPDRDPLAPAEFYNLARWEAELEALSRMGYNALVLLGNHPYPWLVANPEFPEAQPIGADELARNARTLRAILSRAGAYGIRLYFLVYNIFVTREFARAHGIEPRGVDSELTRAYTRSYVTRFFEAFPEVAGLVVTVGESPLGCVAFCREAIFEPLARLASRPNLIVRDQSVYPDEMRALAGGYDRWNTLVKLSEEQFLGDAMGLRGRLQRCLTGVPTIHLVSWLPDGLFFGAYRMIRDMVRQGREQHSDGFLLHGGREPEWLLREAYGYYLTHAATSDAADQAHFERLIRERFGADAPAALLLETADSNSRILPTVRKQLYSRNWNYRARYGLVLESVLALPSFSGFTHPPDAFMRGDLEEAFSGWIPREERLPTDWLSIEEHVTEADRSASAAVKTPPETVRELEHMAEVSFRALPALRAATIAENGKLWGVYLDQMEFQAHVARFYARKLEAAISWARWRHGQVPLDRAEGMVREKLTASLDAYREAVAVYERLHGEGAPRERFRVPRPGADGRADYVWAPPGGMRKMGEIFHREIEAVASRMRKGAHAVPTCEELWEINHAEEA